MPETELERARQHLLLTQSAFQRARLNRQPWVLTAEQHFLAALSWVWDAQERARERDWSKMTQAEIFADLSSILPFSGPRSAAA